MNGTLTNTASDKQLRLIDNLKRERDLTGADTQKALELSRQLWHLGQFSTKAASALIDALFAAPKVKRDLWGDAVKPEPVAGVYEFEQVLYRVYNGQQSGKMLVQEIVANAEGAVGSVEYQYLGLATKHLPTGAVRLTVEQVGALGKTFDHCLLCGRRLDVPESVDRGIGPVCYKRYVA